MLPPGFSTKQATQSSSARSPQKQNYQYLLQQVIISRVQYKPSTVKMARLLAVFVLVAMIAGISAAPQGKGLVRALLDTYTLL